MKKSVRTLLVVVGVAGLLSALAGLLYNGVTLATAWSGAFDEMGSEISGPHFYAAFYVMSGICVSAFVLLGFFSTMLMMGKIKFVMPTIGLLVLEVVYFLSISMMWMHPDYGMSIGAATGVANGGLMFQFMILLPLWAPILLLIANHLRKNGEANQTTLGTA